MGRNPAISEVNVLRTSLVAVAFALICAWPLTAKYAQWLIDQVPVDRLVANLELVAKERPQDAATQINLARAHGMAYAEKTETAPVRRDQPVLGVYFGHEPPNIPYKAQSTNDPAKLAAAGIHLKKSIEHFQAAVALAPDSLVARLGLAWSIEQSGDTRGAISAYRDVIERAWKIEGAMTRAGLGFAPVTAEASDYLIPLLDKEKDAGEISTLRDRSRKLRRLPRSITPVAIPLRDGLHLTDILDDDVAVRFDADGTGAKLWTWITPDAAWLVYDQKGRGEIRSALQLFGSVTFWMFWEHGYDAMRALDDNRDGRLAGRELRHLHLWRDINSNGISERSEVQSLAAYDVISLGLDFVRMADLDQTPFVLKGVSFRDGSTRPTWDVLLQPAR